MPGSEQDEGIGGLLTRLVEDGKGYAQAEIAYYRTLAARKVAEARTGLLLALLALVLALAAAIALIVGSVLTLATLVGPGYATLIVVVVTLGLAALIGWLAVRRIGRAFGGDS